MRCNWPSKSVRSHFYPSCSFSLYLTQCIFVSLGHGVRLARYCCHWLRRQLQLTAPQNSTQFVKWNRFNWLLTSPNTHNHTHRHTHTLLHMRVCLSGIVCVPYKAMDAILQEAQRQRRWQVSSERGRSVCVCVYSMLLSFGWLPGHPSLSPPLTHTVFSLYCVPALCLIKFQYLLKCRWTLFDSSVNFITRMDIKYGQQCVNLNMTRT